MSQPEENRKEKLMAAAMAAVSAYLQLEEEACHQKLTAAMAPPRTQQAPQPAFNLWGQSGRQGMMQMRNLMQIKAFQR